MLSRRKGRPDGRRQSVGRRVWVVALGLVAAAACAGVGGGAGAAALSLKDCEDLATRNNPGLAQARWVLSGSEATRLSNSSAFLPSLTFQLARSSNVSSYSYTRTDPNTGLIIQGNQRQTSNLWPDQLALSQNLIHPPSWYRYRAAGADVAAQRESLRGSQADLILSVRQQYFALLKAILLEQVAVDAVGVAEDQLKKSQALFDVGSVAKSDVLQARVNRANAVRDEITARNTVDQQRALLAVQLGMSVSDSLDIRQDISEPAADTLINEAAMIKESLSALPEVRRSQAAYTAAQLRYSSAFWSQLPTMGLTLYYQKQASTLGRTLDLSKVDTDASWGASIGLRWNIFDGLSSFGAARGAKAAVYQAREDRRQQELSAALGVREAHIAIHNAREGITAADESVALAQESLKLQQALYENGGATILEVNSAQVDLTRAKEAQVEARIALHLAYAQLDRALGR